MDELFWRRRWFKRSIVFLGIFALMLLGPQVLNLPLQSMPDWLAVVYISVLFVSLYFAGYSNGHAEEVTDSAKRAELEARRREDVS